MKAHMPPKDQSPKEFHLTGAGPYHGHPIRLTIGMIVKNEEKTLDRCLSSLKPLMEAVESELIVTDTGSTDRTVEIAKKYTDHILRFKWCGDFSAARNTGLKEARGEWFLFLDGDEWFGDTSGLIEFFTGGECDKYGSASYLQRNYSDLKGEKYADFPVLRISRMYKGIRFRHIVHEDFGRMAPTKFLDDYVHHYGYIFRSEKGKREKFDRNRELLERELRDDPGDLKAYCQLSRQYLAEDTNLTEKYCGLGLQAEQEHPDRGRRISLLHNLAEAYYNAKKYEKLLSLVEDLVRKEGKAEIPWLDFHSYAQSAAFVLGEYERSIRHGQAYLQVYEQYRAGELDRDLTLIAPPALCLPRHREQALRLLAETALHRNDAGRAWEALDRLDLSVPDSAAPALQLACRVCAEAKDWAKLAAFYRRACSAAGEDRLPEVRRGMEAALPADAEQREAAARALAAIPEEDDPCVRLCRLRKAEAEGDRGAAAAELDWFFRWDGDWDPAYSDALFYGMKEAVDLLPLILKIDPDDLKACAVNMLARHSDFTETVRRYFAAFSFDDVKGLFWSLCLRETMLLNEPEPLPEEEEGRLFEEYAAQSARYVSLLYRPELLSPSGLSALPRAYRFGWYMGEALSARDRADGEAYLSNLRLALKSCPAMKHQISLLLERFEREEELRRQKAAEFAALAKQVKERIRELLAQGKRKEAGQVTLQLAALLPNDPDVVRFRSLTHTAG